MVAKEVARTNAFISKLADERFGRIDIARTGAVSGSQTSWMITRVGMDAGGMP